MPEILLPCPNCETEMAVPDTIRIATCPNCQARLNVDAQLAYLRGLSAFEEGQEVMQKISPRRRRRIFNPEDTGAMALFREAYSSLQLAFEADLEESQRQLGVEMMASMAQEFSLRMMVSELEAAYWKTLMVEQTAQNEYDSIKGRLARSAAGPIAALARWRWRIRQNQLRRSLETLDRKLQAFERQIAFIQVPHARNKKWAP